MLAAVINRGAGSTFSVRQESAIGLLQAASDAKRGVDGEAQAVLESLQRLLSSSRIRPRRCQTINDASVPPRTLGQPSSEIPHIRSLGRDSDGPTEGRVFDWIDRSDHASWCTDMRSDAITLESIVEGQRCTPLSLQEFELYLKHKAHSLENLQFHLYGTLTPLTLCSFAESSLRSWYTDYRKRFFALPLDEIERSPAPQLGSALYAKSERPALSPPRGLLSWAAIRSSETPSGRSSPSSSPEKAAKSWSPELTFQPEQSASTSISSRKLPAAFWRRRGSKQEDGGVELDISQTTFGPICHPERGEHSPSRRGSKESEGRWSRRGSKDDSAAAAQAPSITISAPKVEQGCYPTRSMFESTVRVSPMVPVPEDDDLPFASELTRVVGNFILPGSPNELNLDGSLRNVLLDTLALDPQGRVTGTTHPDVFQRVNEVCWGALRDVSLPDFLRFAAGNINSSKTLFWYAVGITDIAVGLLISLCCLVFAHSRWARLAGTPFLLFGTMQVYSASRHFCTQVYGRDARQLYPWELADPSLRQAVAAEDPAGEDATAVEKGKESYLVTPWEHDQSALATLPVLRSKPSKGVPLIRVPVFAPETRVKDPYIVAVQQRLIKMILAVGVVGCVAFDAVLVSVPEL